MSKWFGYVKGHLQKSLFKIIEDDLRWGFFRVSGLNEDRKSSSLSLELLGVRSKWVVAWTIRKTLLFPSSHKQWLKLRNAQILKRSNTKTLQTFKEIKMQKYKLRHLLWDVGSKK
jgi:hypothetical protein